MANQDDRVTKLSRLLAILFDQYGATDEEAMLAMAILAHSINTVHLETHPAPEMTQ